MPSPPPFNARVARTLREKLGMAPGHVAYAMRTSYGMAHVTPGHVTAWERGAGLPTDQELAALAGALWCAPHELMGSPRSLREHRIARGLAAEDVARVTGVGLRAYLEMEETGRWAGDGRQSARLGTLLAIPPREFIAVTGHEGELARLLTEAVTTRWQAHIRAIARLVSMDRRDLQDTLRTMQEEYHALLTATLGRGGGTGASAEEGRRYLDEIVDRFWSQLPEH